MLHLFQKTSDIHSYNTRSSTSGKFYIKSSRLEMKKKSFFWLGAKQWNNIPRYITDCFCRKQFVQYNGYNSSSLDITCGVPQGSILGPLLFLVYIKDPCNVSKVLELMLFADDTNIFYSHTDASYLMEVVNLELKKITCWFYTNKLSINVKKSNFIIFRPRQNRQTLDLAFNISNYSIDRVKEATFLGVILDEHLTWKS